VIFAQGDARVASMSRIIVAGPSWVGDMVLAQSLFKLIKGRHPQSRLEVLAPAWTLPLLERMPEVDEAIPAPFVHGRFDLSARVRLGRELRARRYDRAIVLPNSWKAALVPWIARARRRSGYVGELRYGLLNDARPLDKRALPRTVDRFVALGLEPGAPMPAPFPMPELRPERANLLRALQTLSHPMPQGPVLALCPGAEFGPAKRWPAEHYAAVAVAKLAKGWEVWLFGSEKDRPATAAVQAASGGRCLDLAGRTTLGEAIDLLSLATAVVSNDSGLMHVAAALGRRLVAIYGSSDPRHTPPMSDKATVVSLGLECSPCFERECPLGHLKCLRELAPARILAALAG
jgi:heptosyltransferase-2